MTVVLSSARANTDTRHRIKIPNSQPRHIKIVGLRKGGAETVSKINTDDLVNVQVVVPGDTNVEALASGKLPLLDDAEMIVVVALPGDDLLWAEPIKKIARSRGVLVTGIVISATEDPHQESGWLAKLRASADMMVITKDSSYLIDMLDQLRT